MGGKFNSIFIRLLGNHLDFQKLEALAKDADKGYAATLLYEDAANAAQKDRKGDGTYESNDEVAESGRQAERSCVR